VLRSQCGYTDQQDGRPSLPREILRGQCRRRTWRAFERGIDAYNRGDFDAVLAVHHPAVEWRPALQVLLGGETVRYRGHEGIREFLRDLDDFFSNGRIEISEIRELGDRLLAEGRWFMRGRESGVETRLPSPS
jgi:ketosteroid isomerase-like protein